MNPLNSSRRDILKTGASLAMASGVAVLFAPFSRGQNQRAPREIVEPKGPKPIDRDLVRKFVGACHRDVDGVKSMLQSEPGLVNASFNRGGNDWENGMEAASHMGRPDIADVLIANKARKSIFWAAMVGEEGIVRAYVTADPDTVNTGGAHNISLMAHAAISGKVSLTRFLKDNGAKVNNKSLEHAVRGNRLEMVEWLVENGADPASKNIFGKFHYEAAEGSGYTEIATFLRSKAKR